MPSAIRSALATACGFLLLAIATAKGADAPVQDETGPPNGGALLFSRPMGTRGQQGTFLREEGQRRRRVCYLQGPHVMPRLSPDGTAVLYHSVQGGTIGVWLVGSDGADARRLCDGSSAEWSPDGSRITLVRDGRVIERDLESGAEEIVSPAAWSTCRFASYGPGGSKLIAVTQSGKDRLFLLGAGGEEPKLVAEGDIESTPRCSPDGRHIACQDGAHIFLVDLAAGTRRQLTLAAGIQACPVWSDDGAMVYYSQRHDPYETTCQIHAVDLKDPSVVRVVEKDADVNFDCAGVVDPLAEELAVKGLTLDQWQCWMAIDVLDAKDWKSTAQRVPAGTGDIPRGGTVAAGNDWLTLAVSNGGRGVKLAAGEKDGPDRPVVIAPRAPGAWRVRSVRVAARDEEEIRLAVEFSADGVSTEVHFTVRRATPVVSIASAETLALTFAAAESEAILIPDRYSNDVVLEPTDLPNAPGTSLPRAPLVVTLTTGGGGLLVSSRGVSEAVISAWKSENGEGAVLTADARAHLAVAVLPRSFWERPTVKQGESSWGVDWTPPVSAQWRLAAVSGGKTDSFMWDGTEDLDETGSTPEVCIAYLWGRSSETPLDVLTLEDVLRDAFGTRRSADLLDTAGIRGWRSARSPVPMQDIFTRPHGWDPTLVHTGQAELGILEALMGIHCVDVEPVRELTRHLGGDMVLLLEGLDDRIVEYRRFLADMEGLCSRTDAPSGEFTAAVKAQLAELNTVLADTHPLGLEAVGSALDNVINNGLKRGSYLYEREEYSRLSEVTRAALADRQEIIRACREFAKRIRDDAGMHIIKHSDAPGIAESARDVAREILRSRYYLEGDWRGEKPTPGGAQ